MFAPFWTTLEAVYGSQRRIPWTRIPYFFVQKVRWFALRNDWKEQKKRLLKTITQVRPAAPSQRTNDALLKASVSRAFAELPKDNPLKMLRPIGQCWVFSVCLLDARILKHDQTSVPLLEKVELLHKQLYMHLKSRKRLSS